MLTVRRMAPSDILFAIRLTDQEGWGVSREDLRRILTLDPEGSFVAVLGATRVGLTTTTSYGKALGWIGNVIVDRSHRGERIGPRLVEHAVRYLLSNRVRRIALYTFDENVDFYERLGFVRDSRFLRLKRKPKASGIFRQSPRNTRPSLKRIFAADKIAFGANRSGLIRKVLTEGLAHIIHRSRSLSDTSYILVKNYNAMCEFGPWINLAGTMKNASQMLQEALIRAGRKPVEISVLTRNRRSLALLRKAGFRRTRSGYRMYFMNRQRVGRDGAQLALGFLDKG